LPEASRPDAEARLNTFGWGALNGAKLCQGALAPHPVTTKSAEPARRPGFHAAPPRWAQP